MPPKKQFILFENLILLYRLYLVAFPSLPISERIILMRWFLDEQDKRHKQLAWWGRGIYGACLHFILIYELDDLTLFFRLQ